MKRAAEVDEPSGPVGDYEASWPEIADVLGVSPQAVQQASRKAIRRLWRMQVNADVWEEMQQRRCDH